MKVGIVLRNGLRYVTGIGDMGDLDIHLIHGYIVAVPDSQDTPEMTVLVKPIEIAFRGHNDEELVRDISALDEEWMIPLTNIDYFTTNEGTIRARKVRGLKWKISFIEELPDPERDKGLAITGKQQQLNFLRSELQELLNNERA